MIALAALGIGAAIGLLWLLLAEDSRECAHRASKLPNLRDLMRKEKK